MGYANISSSFTPKEKISEDDIREFLRKHEGLDEDENVFCLDDWNVVGVNEDGSVSVDLSDEVESDDFDTLESQWKAIVNHFADFSNGAIHVTGDYDDYDGNKSDIDYHIGPAKLVLQAEIKILEEKRDAIEVEIAQKRRELSGAQVESQ